MITMQNWGQLSAIQIGGVICMPTLMIGQTLTHHFGFTSAIVAVLLGNALLFSLGLISAKMGVEKRKTTMENAIDYFGKEKVRFFSLAMGFSLICWFAIQLNMMTLGVMDLFSLDKSSTLIPASINIVLGTVITLVALYGVKGISFLANISLPLLLATIGYAAYTVDRVPSDTPDLPFTFSGVSLVIAMAIACIIDLPTYYRHAKSAKHAMISIIIVFGFCLPLLQMLGVYLASMNPDGTFLDIFKRNNSVLWNYWTATFLILAGWTTNNVNLYSGVICLGILMKKTPLYLLTIIFGVINTFLSCFDLLAHFAFVLEVIGIFIGSMGGLIFGRYLLSKIRGLELSPQDQTLHLVGWSIGIIIGLASWMGYSFTGIAVLDATFGGAAASLLILTQRRSYEKIYSQ